ncbi:unnamed protein product [Prunus armeniaca]
MASVYLHEFRRFWGLNIPLSRGCAMRASTLRKEVQMYAGPRDASDSMQDGIHRFFGCLWLGTGFQQLT